MFRSILIANRGEIAVRIIRACRNMGIKSIAVYSKEDKDSLHVQLADRRVCIGEGPAKNSYLNMERIISAAKNTDADAIHPGFGFLSENADFVRLCKENGIAFIGPSADVIDSMGNKSHARKTMMEAGVPVVPGTKDPVYDVETGEKLADEIGYPVMVRSGFICMMVIPLVFLILMFSLESKLVYLILWIVSLLALILYLLIVEYLHEEMKKKSVLGEMSSEELMKILKGENNK